MFLSKFVPATVVLASVCVGSAGAQVLLRVPEDSPGIPAYARVERPFVYHTNEWAAIVFYRDPACVPIDFNLLDLFDAPRAFGCALTYSGFEIWDNPATDLGPRHTISSGTSVPVWFVPWTALEAAIADDELTMTELESLAPLKGVAKTFQEMHNPVVPPGTAGGAKVGQLTITTSGVLPDGRSFQYEYTAVSFPPQVKHVRIVFR